MARLWRIRDGDDPQRSAVQVVDNGGRMFLVLTSGFSPSSFASFAMKAVDRSLPFIASTPSIQYGTGSNALIALSRSTSRRSATDCTRPAESEYP